MSKKFNNIPELVLFTKSFEHLLACQNFLHTQVKSAEDKEDVEEATEALQDFINVVSKNRKFIYALLYYLKTLDNNYMSASSMVNAEDFTKYMDLNDIIEEQLNNLAYFISNISSNSSNDVEAMLYRIMHQEMSEIHNSTIIYDEPEKYDYIHQGFKALEYLLGRFYAELINAGFEIKSMPKELMEANLRDYGFVEYIDPEYLEETGEIESLWDFLSDEPYEYLDGLLEEEEE